MAKSPKTISNKTGASSTPPEHSAINSQTFEAIARESLRVSYHLQLMLWLGGEFQRSIPHEIFIAAWGDLPKGQMQHDVVSAIPSVRTGQIANQDISQCIGDLFGRWVENECSPIGAQFEGGLRLRPEPDEREELKAFQSMRSAMVHGIRDARGNQSCLYVFLSEDPFVAPSSLESLRVMLPFIDAASRRVAHLPNPMGDEAPPPSSAILVPTDLGLSSREREIMDWVELGKTNHEIGIILDISTFTVKNHLQRIFRKLDVTNRAQAVSRVQRFGGSPEGTPAAGAAPGDVQQKPTGRPDNEER